MSHLVLGYLSSPLPFLLSSDSPNPNFKTFLSSTKLNLHNHGYNWKPPRPTDHHRRCLPVWPSHLLRSLSFLVLSSPAVAKLLLAQHHHLWRCFSAASPTLVAVGYPLFLLNLFSFLYGFFFSSCLLTDFGVRGMRFCLMNNILFHFWLAWWMGFLVWISGISNNCYYWHF